MTKYLLKQSPKFYYINLIRSSERKDRMERLFQEYELEYERIDAIDGDKLDDWDERLSKYEQACTLSHLKAIQTFYESDRETAIICEDDLSFEFVPYWKKSLSLVIRDAPQDCDILLLGYIVLPHDYTTLNQEYNSFIAVTHNSTLCYFITKKAAEMILKNHNPKHPNLKSFTRIRPVADVIIYDLVKTYVYKYSMFTYPDNNSSTIHSNHSDLHTQSKSKAKEVFTE
jgi:GR25 family glycosyltransferase involved in LPS biosynthesis